jgi:hypothetical protein
MQIHTVPAKKCPQIQIKNIKVILNYILNIITSIKKQQNIGVFKIVIFVTST